MTLRPFGLTLAALAAAPLLFASPTARAQEAAADLPREEVEAIVREYLLREPEILMEAFEILEQRQQEQAQQAQAMALSDQSAALKEDERDPVLGAEDAGVTLVEFYDYRCGYCRSMIPALEQLREDHPDVRYVMKEFPILGPQSTLAAEAALAAAEQGAFQPFHDALMRAQTIDEALVDELAEEHGLDVEKLRADMKSDAVQSHIADNLALAQSLGINGTPTFIIGDTVIPGAVPVAELSRLIEAEAEAGKG